MKKKLFLTQLLVASICLNAQVSLVKDINPGGLSSITSSSYLKLYDEYNGKLIFTANDGSGHEAWISDGTNAGTYKIIDLNNSSFGSHPYAYVKWQGKVAFLADDNQTSSQELYLTDGTALGTQNITTTSTLGLGNIDAVSNQSTELLLFSTKIDLLNTNLTSITNLTNQIPNGHKIVNGFIFFQNGDGELSISNGTPAGTIPLKDINPGNTSSSPTFPVYFNGKYYFTANDGASGRELWVTDGTALGTQMVLDLYPGPIGSNPTELTVFNNFLIFSATHPSFGTEIFKMTTTENITNLKNINSGTGNSSPFGYTVFNNELYFAADDGTNGIELWKSGGFPANTIMLKDINSSGESTPQGFTEYNNKLYFNADDGINGRELWATDGSSSGTIMVHDIFTPGNSSSDPLNLIVVNNSLFFYAIESPLIGRELYKYDDPTLSLSDIKYENSISLLPNPTNSSFSLNSKLNPKKILVINAQGKTVKSFNRTSDKYYIDDLTTGIYFIKINTEKGDIVKKLIKY